MIRLVGIKARFGGFRLGELNLHVPAGAYAVLLGPSGSGKSCLLELICGLRRCDAGQILLAGRSLGHLDPSQRQIGYVPQDYALFPTHDVCGNIAFGLKVRRLHSGLIRQKVEATAERLGITPLLGRSCTGLSGGERQRVALARALVLEPRVLLLDEPVSALDELSRQRICLELRELHQSLGMTTLHVSHNPDETSSVADLVGVLQDGRLAQWGTVEEVIDKPASTFVAQFVGGGNILRGRVQPAVGGSGCRFEWGGQVIDLLGVLPAGPACMLLQSHEVELARDGQAPPPGHIQLTATVLAVRRTSHRALAVQVRARGGHLTIEAPGPQGRLRPGQQVIVFFDASRLRPLVQDDLAGASP